ncbi:adenine-specific methyltransferase EcoRI family protein [Brachyspira pulli]|uniref:adenine-specific methyltransferase EcoRI family protein n=1 Tax=Brachyspira pulli TaxID=310721 RepID=UPI0030054D67
MANKNLKKAKINKKDEFYTQLNDIEKELNHYTEYFKDKIIFCNCDDPEYSNFWKYFELNFEKLGLKKLVATHFEKEKTSYKIELTKDENNDGKINSLDIIKTKLKQNGDFRSPECIEILKEVDIVITNPPFSLFREYVAQLIEYNKKFIIIGNQNAISYKEIFSLIKNNYIWLGYSIHSGDREFKVPNDYELKASGIRVDIDGNKFIRVKGIRWFTNLEYSERHENLILYKSYNEEDYPKYENYDAINVDQTKDIPKDFNGVMGVPITFLDKYNPEQFDIIGLGIVGSCNFLNNRKMAILDKFGNETGKYTYNAKGTLYRKYNPNKDEKPPAFKDVETGELYSSIYARILIKKK